jgi:hypothetical protein
VPGHRWKHGGLTQPQCLVEGDVDSRLDDALPVLQRTPTVLAMFAASRGHSRRDLLDTFGQLRRESLHRLVALGLTDADLLRRGRHPEFGVVTYLPILGPA